MDDSYRCVADEHVRNRGKTWCGKFAAGFVFEDAEHAAQNGRQEGSLVACPDCVAAITKGLRNGLPDEPTAGSTGRITLPDYVRLGLVYYVLSPSDGLEAAIKLDGMKELILDRAVDGLSVATKMLNDVTGTADARGMTKDEVADYIRRQAGMTDTEVTNYIHGDDGEGDADEPD